MQKAQNYSPASFVGSFSSNQNYPFERLNGAEFLPQADRPVKIFVASVVALQPTQNGSLLFVDYINENTMVLFVTQVNFLLHVVCPVKLFVVPINPQ